MPPGAIMPEPGQAVIENQQFQPLGTYCLATAKPQKLVDVNMMQETSAAYTKAVLFSQKTSF